MAETLKPYFVELTYTAVVMAACAGDAEFKAESLGHRIVGDCGAPWCNATEVRSLDHLKRLDSGWDGNCGAYGGGEPRLSEVLPEEDPPERDTKTLDLFGGQVGGAA